MYRARNLPRVWSGAVVFWVLLVIHNGLHCVLAAKPELAATSSGASSRLPPLRVSKDGHCLERTDGAPFFWLADTAWALHTTLSRRDVQKYLDDAIEKDFTVFGMWTVLDIGGCRSGTKYANFSGDEPYIDGDPTRLNPPYWDHLGWVIKQADQRGLYVLLVCGAPMRRNWQYVASVRSAYAHGNAMGRALGIHANLIWCNGMDIEPTGRRAVPLGLKAWDALAEGIADGVTGVDRYDGVADHDAVLMTFHPAASNSSSRWFHQAPWLDFNGAQIVPDNKQNIYELLSADYRRTPVKPTINLEPLYEEGTRRGITATAWTARLQAYQSLFAGAFGHTYGHGKIWPLDGPPRFVWLRDYTRRWRENLDDHGRVQMQYVRRLMESHAIPGRVPDLPVIVASQDNDHQSRAYDRRIAATGTNDGSYAFIYSPLGRRFTVKMDVFPSPHVRACWYDPRTGQRKDAGRFRATAQYEFDPPGEPKEGNDWVLVLDGVPGN